MYHEVTLFISPLGQGTFLRIFLETLQIREASPVPGVVRSDNKITCHSCSQHYLTKERHKYQEAALFVKMQVLIIDVFLF